MAQRGRGPGFRGPGGKGGSARMRIEYAVQLRSPADLRRPWLLRSAGVRLRPWVRLWDRAVWGGLEPELLQPKSYQYLLAFIFATEEVNRNPHLLPNVSLGFDLYNAIHSEWKTLESTLTWLSAVGKAIPNYSCVRKSKSVAVIVGITWAISAQIGTLLELYKFPQLTYGPFDQILGENHQFTYQMVSRESSLALGMVSLMLHFHWTWVGLVISEDTRGIQFLWDIRDKMNKNEVCVAFVEMLSVMGRTYASLDWHYHFRILESTANVVVIYGDTNSLMSLSFSRHGILVTWKVWITTSQWDFITSEDELMMNTFHGTLSFSHSHDEIPGFKHFLKTMNPSKYPEDFYLSKFWYLYFPCSISMSDCETLQGCPANASLEDLPVHVFDMSMSEGSYHIYNAVHAVAHTLHEMLLQRVEVQPVRNGDGLTVYPWQVLYLVWAFFLCSLWTCHNTEAVLILSYVVNCFGV
ncbi:vomeronasal type-2 receptor 116-like [Lepus europaeus]|uniref:vomeronasal type-2 receptor 116-like n=1 Tax=Lepus europaeus TaxID=9983 RepID=UPI002B484F48|nr:vomeronasal type-2 receptor 116-like [Lepus europaeus]